MTPEHDPSQQTPGPWVRHDVDSASGQDWLVGNRTGLELLAKKLEDVFHAGAVTIDEREMEFRGVRIMEGTPSAKPKGWEDAVGVLGCALLALSIAIVFVAGVIQIWSWLN